MATVLISALKIGFATIIIGQGVKIIGKKEFKALVDIVGFTSFGIIVAEKVIKDAHEFTDAPIVKFIVEVVKKVKDIG